MSQQKRVAVVLSGCGYLDGSEIHEATLTLLALDRAGAESVAVAPDVEQRHVVDHVRAVPVAGERRRVLVESARIARGKVSSLATLAASEVDAAVFPGGYGAAKNLSTFAADGAAMTVAPDVERFVRELYDLRKPMGFACISPVIAAKVLGRVHPTLTIGEDPETAAAIEAMGGKHVPCPVDSVIADADHRIVSTPAYMLDTSIAKVHAGIEKLVRAVLEMA